METLSEQFKLESDCDRQTSLGETAYCVECCNLSPGWIREVNEDGKVFYHPPEGEVIDSKEELQKVHGKDLTNFDFFTGVWTVQECSVNIDKEESIIKEEDEDYTKHDLVMEYSICSQELENGKQSTLANDKIDYDGVHNEVKQEIPSDDEYETNGIIFPCIRCNEDFQTSQAMLNHALSHSIGKIITPDTLFVAINTLDDGITTIKEDNNNKEEVCRWCKKKFKQIKMHIAESTVCNSKYKIPEDGSDNIKVIELKGILSFTCRGCHKDFKEIAKHLSSQSSKCRTQYSNNEIETHKHCIKKLRNRKNYIENKEKILRKKSKYYEDNKEKILEQKKSMYYEYDKGEVSLKQSKYYGDNKEKILEKSAKYYKDNKEKILKKNAKYYKDNKEKILIKMSKYYEDNKETMLEKMSKYYEDNKRGGSVKMSNYYEDNKEKILEKHAKYYQNNKEKLRKKMAKYYEDNKKKISIQKSKYYEDNKMEINKKKSKYNADNKEKALDKKSKYNEDNKKKMLGKKSKYNENINEEINKEKFIGQRSRYDVEYQQFLNSPIL